MHELSLCHAIAGVVAPHAVGRRVDVVRVRVGALRQIVPDTLSFCWGIVRDSDGLPGAELELELVAAAVECRACGARSELTSRWSVRCPGCGSTDVTVVAGEEFLVMSIDLADELADDVKGVRHG